MTLTTPDGLFLADRTLYVTQNQPGQVAVVELSADYGRGEILGSVVDPSFRFPTAVANYGGRLGEVTLGRGRVGSIARQK